jgi:hypothetical protein
VTLRVGRRDPLSYVLFDRDAEVGWMRGGIVGFGGFPDRASARRAAEVAALVLAEWYQTRWYDAPQSYAPPVPQEDGITASGVVVGRLVGPLAAPAGRAGSYGFELALPRETWVAVMAQLAQRIYGALVGELSAVGEPAEEATA